MSTLSRINLKSDNLFFVLIIVFELFHCGTETLLRRDWDKDNMVVVTKAFSKTSTVHTNTPSRHFRAFSRKFRFGHQKHRIRVVGRPIRKNKSCIFKFIRLSVDLDLLTKLALDRTERISALGLFWANILPVRPSTSVSMRYIYLTLNL